MDVFYYWKDIDQDLKAGRVGYFQSAQDRLKEFQEGSPDYIWVFKTPPGLKGQVQLKARLRWSDVSVTPFTRVPGKSYMHYDPSHADSLRFSDTATPEAVAVATDWVKRHFPTAISSNFQGANGQHAMRGPVVSELRRFADGFHTEPLLTPPV